jgi:transcriptional regulator
MSILDKGIVQRTTVSALVTAYQTAMTEIDQGYATLYQAQSRLRAAFGEGANFDTIETHSYRSSDPASVKMKIRKAAWRQIISMIEVEKIMSTKALKQLREKLEDDKQVPEITTDSVVTILEAMRQNSGEYAKQMILEVYEWLMRGQSSYDDYKTNAKNARRALGKKVIIAGVLQSNYLGGTRISYGYTAQDMLNAVDKVFHSLDGKGVPDGYCGPLVDAINASVSQGSTDYFFFKKYLNSNLHLEFKRLDLVEQINRIAGGKSRLPD